MWLEKDEFQRVLSYTPLVSIDLVITNASGEVLLGKRNNRPAQGYWFVPGGRIQKNESLASAFARLTAEELGVKQEYTRAQLLGAFDHFYTDCVFGESPSTHYVALAHKVTLKETPKGNLEIDAILLRIMGFSQKILGNFIWNLDLFFLKMQMLILWK